MLELVKTVELAKGRDKIMKTRDLFQTVALSAVLLVGATSQSLAAKQAPSTIPVSSYYKVPAIFTPFPEPGKDWSIKYYGPVGIGIDLISPPFTMRINNVEAGSPAEAAGKLKKGQIIESINGETLKDIDPRVQLAQILEKAEATDGVMKLKIKDEGEVVVKLPVLGAYSKTWPLNCPKSAKIVRNMGDRLAKLEKPEWSAGPFLLSTGEDKDLETYKRWLKIEIPAHDYPWYIGFWGTSVCEYYLRTGDSNVMPAINKMAASLKASMYDGSWMGRGSRAPNYGYMGGGHMNAAGVHALNFLLLAKECGAEVDDYLLQRVLFQFFRFAGRGNVAYGNQTPEGGFRDNGKTAGLAMAMSSAASLAPEGESSVYAAARDNSAMKSFYATTWFNRAHTGGGIGEIWHGVGMQLVADKKPVQYRSFMDERKWFFELSRHADGSFGVNDGARYDGTDWGNYHALAYTASRKKLRMFGAPKTQWCKTYALPKRPWGTAADDVFYSLKPGEYLPGKVQDIDKETIKTDASGPIFDRIASSNVTDDVLLMYANHPDYGIRSSAADKIVKFGRNHLIMPLLKSKDPRVREVGVLTLAGMFKGAPIPADKITEEMQNVLAEMINNPEESRWVVCGAMEALSRCPPEKIIPHVDRLLTYLNEKQDWWTQAAALKPLAKVSADERVYKKVLPAFGEMIAGNTAMSILWPAGEVSKVTASAKPEVQKLAFDVFMKTYQAIPSPYMAPGGANLNSAERIIKSTVTGWMKTLPGGSDTVLKMPKTTSVWSKTKKDSDKYVYSGTFTPSNDLMGKWQTVAMAKSAEAYQAQLEKQAADEAKAKAAAEAAKLKGKQPAPPAAPKPPPRYGIGSMELQDAGKVGGPRGFVWSGNILINGGSEEALKMVLKTIKGKEYLLVEAGGFTQTNEKIEDEASWDPNYFVMERVAPPAPKKAPPKPAAKPVAKPGQK
jgi:hypothetical protein